MKDILQSIAISNDWVFEYSREDYRNLYKDSDTSKESVIHLFLDPIKVSPIVNDYGVTEENRFQGTFMLVYSSHIDEESYNDRYEKYIKPILKNYMELVKDELTCNYEGNIDQWSAIEVINILDYNSDGLICTYDIRFNAEEKENIIATISSDNNGQVLPQEGSIELEFNSCNAYYAMADENYQFDKWLLNGAEKTDNPISITALRNFTLNAKFKLATVFQTFAELGNSAPVQVGNEWRFLNNAVGQSADNYVDIKKRIVGFFDGHYGQTIQHQNIPFTLSPSFEIITKPYKTGSTTSSAIYGRVGSANELFYYIFPNSISQLSLFTENGEEQFKSSFTANAGEWAQYGFSVNNDTKEVLLFKKVLSTGVITTNSFTLQGTIIDRTAITRVASFFGSGLFTYFGLIANYNINNGQCIAVLNSLNGIDVFDISGNDYHGELLQTVISEFYLPISDSDYLEPYEYTMGCSIYMDNASPTDITKAIIVVYREDGQPVLSTPPTGYSLLGHFPAGSGFLPLVNEFLFNNASADFIQFFESYVMGNIETNKTFKELYYWDDTAKIIKEGDGNNISKLTLKQ